MNKKAFFERFLKQLKNMQEKWGLDNIHDALIVWYGENYLSLDPEDVVERIVEDKRAEGIDSILIDQSNYNLIFVQAKTVGSFAKTSNNFRERDVKATLEGVRFLLKGDYQGKITPELENMVDEYHEYDESGDYSTIVRFLTLKKKPLDLKFINAFKKEFPEIEVVFFDFDSLYDFYKNVYLVRTAKPPEKISFKVLTSLVDKDEPYRSRIFTCKGEELAKIYNDYRERIFQQNVRYSLGMRSKSINRQIYETAVDASGSVNFWYFNNGITIICDKIVESTSRKVMNLTNAQIINGAQTTYALHEAYQNGTLRDDVEVLIKVVEASDDSFIESITLYTNSQNPIRLRDLCSNDRIQTKLQKELIHTYGYFYERKRGEFSSSYTTAAARKKLLGNNYQAKLISNENAAQAFLAMYLDKPSQAKAEKRRIFMKDEAGFYEDIFNDGDEILAEKMLMAWRLLKYIENKKKEYRKDYKKADGFSKAKRQKVYRYDFLLHAEYFILNLFKDFPIEAGLDIYRNKESILEVVTKIETDDAKIAEIYDKIAELLADYLGELRKRPGYYHNKFFKSEKSISPVRDFFRKKYKFVETLV